MDISEQIKQIRIQKHQQYLDYCRRIEEKENEEIKKQNEEIKKQNEKELMDKKINYLTELHDKYKNMFDPKTSAAKKIQNFVRKNYFEPHCVNELDMNKIPPLYRLRITITNHHVNEYNEENIEQSMLDMHRLIYKMMVTVDEKINLFRYCFDIRELYPKRNKIIELYDGFYFMQPDDHIRINTLWDKVNGETNKSIIFMSQFEYYKCLSVDEFKKNNCSTNQDETKKHIEKLLQSHDIDNENINFDLVQNDIPLDNDFLHSITRKYIVECDNNIVSD
ncbi:hypothetical protein QJ857_gp0531 [Tupanvirus soda lake]|uniref:Uncharacterized protein n=2 Tax=Tupanvirus TaxID=2094720 RepID=A0A6N1NNI8_9VIRU|nr:hypothetical protein QJ857_gp0531 [Tupanvirus soda lake]QKU35510.1 hypothetical protein [Tupanvirus soda lake]